MKIYNVILDSADTAAELIAASGYNYAASVAAYNLELEVEYRPVCQVDGTPQTTKRERLRVIKGRIDGSVTQQSIVLERQDASSPRITENRQIVLVRHASRLSIGMVKLELEHHGLRFATLAEFACLTAQYPELARTRDLCAYFDSCHGEPRVVLSTPDKQKILYVGFSSDHLPDDHESQGKSHWIVAVRMQEGWRGEDASRANARSDGKRYSRFDPTGAAFPSFRPSDIDDGFVKAIMVFCETRGREHLKGNLFHLTPAGRRLYERDLGGPPPGGWQTHLTFDTDTL